MARDIYGETYTTDREYARLVIPKLMYQDRYEPEISLTDRGISMKLPEPLGYGCGMYSIFHEDEAIYIGYGSFVHNRVYRYYKEYHGRSRPDETHFGARKARELYPDSFFSVSVLKEGDFPVASNYNFNPQIDEFVAGILNTTCNTHKRI
jgi:hypothetical protein